MDGSIDKRAAQNRASFERFEAFYDYAFPRVYRFAQRKAASEAQAEALCRLILVRALSSLGGLRTGGSSPDPADLAVWLYSVARRVSEEVERDPSLLESIAGSAEAGRVAPVADGPAGRGRAKDPSLEG